jgi:hypothetical protein
VNCLGDAFDGRRLSGIDRTPELESKSLDIALEIGGFGIVPARDDDRRRGDSHYSKGKAESQGEIAQRLIP